MNEMLRYPLKQRKTSVILKKAMSRGNTMTLPKSSSHSTKNLPSKDVPLMNSSGIQTQTMGNGFKMF